MTRINLLEHLTLYGNRIRANEARFRRSPSWPEQLVWAMNATGDYSYLYSHSLLKARLRETEADNMAATGIEGFVSLKEDPTRDVYRRER